MQSVVPEGFLVSLAWTGFKENDKTLETFLKLMSSKSLDQFQANGLQDNSFNLILVVADETEINSVFIGNAPKRKIENDTRGQVVTPGWKIENKWVSELKEEDSSIVLASKNGLILNTNNSFLETKSNAASKSVNIINSFCFNFFAKIFNKRVHITCRLQPFFFW